MFNIYYINYQKAYEIAMLIDNKILQQEKKKKPVVLMANLLGMQKHQLVKFHLLEIFFLV